MHFHILLTYFCTIRVHSLPHENCLIFIVRNSRHTIISLTSKYIPDFLILNFSLSKRTICLYQMSTQKKQFIAKVFAL